MKVKIKARKKKIILTPTRHAIIQYAGKLHEQYIKKKISVGKVRNLVDYSDL